MLAPARTAADPGADQTGRGELGHPEVALPDDRMHAPNERFCLSTFFRGIEASIHFLAELARGEAL